MDEDLVEVNLTFRGVRHAEDELTPFLAGDGVFVPTPDPLPISTVVRVRVDLPEELRLFAATGVVFWTRGTGEQDGLPGMAVRFVSLSDRSEAVVQQLIAAHRKRGGEQFELDPRLGETEAMLPLSAHEPREVSFGVSIGASSPPGEAGEAMPAEDHPPKEVARPVVLPESPPPTWASGSGFEVSIGEGDDTGTGGKQPRSWTRPLLFVLLAVAAVLVIAAVVYRQMASASRESSQEMTAATEGPAADLTEGNVVPWAEIGEAVPNAAVEIRSREDEAVPEAVGPGEVATLPDLPGTGNDVEDAEPPAAPSGPATEVLAVVWSGFGSGTTVLVRTDGLIVEDRVQAYPMLDPPRLLVQLRDILVPYPEYHIDVGTDEVDQIRIGHHPELRRPSIYVVLDLASDGVVLDEVEIDGQDVEIRVSSAGAS